MIRIWIILQQHFSLSFVQGDMVAHGGFCFVFRRSQAPTPADLVKKGQGAGDSPLLEALESQNHY